MSDFWEVEKVLKKRICKNGQIQYLIKWVGWSESKWVNDYDCRCDETIHEFEVAQLVKFLGKFYIISTYLKRICKLLMFILAQPADHIFQILPKNEHFRTLFEQFCVLCSPSHSSLFLFDMKKNCRFFYTKGVGKCNGQIRYAARFRDGEIKAINSRRARKMWPEKTKDFLENYIRFVTPAMRHVSGSMMEDHQRPCIGSPVVLAATDTNNELSYMIQWPSGGRKLVKAADANPIAVLTYLELNLSIDPAQSIESDCRSKYRKINEIFDL